MEMLKQKLSSRKLWAAIVAVLASAAAVLLGDQLTPEVVDALECAVKACIAYIFGEGIVDAARQAVSAAKEKYGVDFSEVIADLKEAEEKEAAETEEDPTAKS